LVGDAAPQHRPPFVHEADEESVCLVVGDSLPVVDATVEGDVDAEGQESHGEESTPSWADRWTVTCRRVLRSGQLRIGHFYLIPRSRARPASCGAPSA